MTKEQDEDWNKVVMVPAGGGMSVLANEIAMEKTYIKIKYEGGECCIVEPKDVPDMTESEYSFTTEEVQMTGAEFEALPEFQS